MASRSPEQQVKTYVNNVKKRLSLSINSKQMGIIARFVIDLIKERSRRGYGVRDNGDKEQKFPKLSKEYIAKRKRSRLSPFTTPSKSNITRTGKMLASLRYTTKTGQALIRPTGERNDSNLSNASLASIVQTKLNRPFMYLSDKQLRELRRFISANIIKIP